jgi:hypothetical protein
MVTNEVDSGKACAGSVGRVSVGRGVADRPVSDLDWNGVLQGGKESQGDSPGRSLQPQLFSSEQWAAFRSWRQ